MNTFALYYFVNAQIKINDGRGWRSEWQETQRADHWLMLKASVAAASILIPPTRRCGSHGEISTLEAIHWLAINVSSFLSFDSFCAIEKKIQQPALTDKRSHCESVVYPPRCCAVYYRYNMLVQKIGILARLFSRCCQHFSQATSIVNSMTLLLPLKVL